MRGLAKTAKGFAITLTPSPLPLAGEGCRTPCQKTFADLLSRGIFVTYESIRQWTLKFGQTYANALRRRQPKRGDK